MNSSTGSRHLDWEGCLNLRDLGGHQTEDGRLTAWGAFVRGDTLCKLSESGRGSLLDYGIRTIVDLRSDIEVEGEPNPFANVPEPVMYVHRPLNDPQIDEAMRSMPTGAERYVAMVEAGRARIAAIFRAMAEAEEGGILFHCFGGRDRTGIVAALLLRLVGVPEEVIVADYEVTDERRRPAYEEWLARAEQEDRDRFLRVLAERGEPIAATLEHVDSRYGGPSGYLRSGGVTDLQIARLRRRLLGVASLPGSAPEAAKPA